MKYFILLPLLFLWLIAVVPAFAQVPSPNCLGNTSCTSVSPTIVPSTNLQKNPSMNPSGVSPSNTGGNQPSSSPCSQSSTKSENEGPFHARHKHHFEGQRGFLQQLIQFLLELIQLLFRMGGLPVSPPILTPSPTTNPCPSPSSSPSVQPSVTGGASVSLAPISKAAPTVQVPTIFNQPTAVPPVVKTTKPNIMVFVLENQSYSDVIGNSSVPTMNSLANSYETATNSYGVGHYSLDNYLAFVSGNFYSSTVNNCNPGPGCQFTDPTIAEQLDTAGVSWVSYTENMPGNCSMQYANNENIGPFLWFPNVVAKDCNKIRPGTNMMSDLNSASPPNFIFYTPPFCSQGGNESSCGGSGTLANADKFVSSKIPAIMATNWYKNNGIIILTFDEGHNGQGTGEFLTGEGNHILTVVISAATAGKPQITTYINLFGELAGIEKAYGVPCLGQACNSASGVLPLP